MWLFIFILATLIGVIWGYYFLIGTTERSINALYQTAAGVTIDLTNSAQTAMHALAQRTFRLLSFLGLPLTEAAELEGATLNRIHQTLVDILNNLHRVIRNLAIIFTIWLGLIIVGTLGGLLADWLFLGVVVISMIILFFTTTTYDPIIAAVAAKYKIRRSIRPVSLLYGLSGVMFMWWLAFHGEYFYPFWMYVLAVYILVLIALGFPSYYFMKTTNKAGVALNTTLIILLVISVIRMTNERIYTNASMYLTNNAEKIADNIADANAEKTLNIFEVTEATPVVTRIGKGGISFGSVITDSGEVILAFQPGDEISVISEDITFVGNEGFVKVMTKNEYGHFVNGPVFIPNRFLTKKESMSKVTVTSENNQSKNQSIENTLDTEDNNTFSLPPGENVKLMYLPQGRENITFRSTGRYKIIERDGPVTVLSRTFNYNTRVAGGMLEVQNIEDYPIQFKVEL